MNADLHIHIPEAPGPIRKQMTSQPLMTHTQPFRRDDDLIGLGLQNFVVDRNERHGKTFGEFRIGEAAFGCIEVTSGA